MFKSKAQKLQGVGGDYPNNFLHIFESTFQYSISLPGPLFHIPRMTQADT